MRSMVSNVLISISDWRKYFFFCSINDDEKFKQSREQLFECFVSIDQTYRFELRHSRSEFVNCYSFVLFEKRVTNIFLRVRTYMKKLFSEEFNYVTYFSHDIKIRILKYEDKYILFIWLVQRWFFQLYRHLNCQILPWHGHSSWKRMLAWICRDLNWPIIRSSQHQSSAKQLLLHTLLQFFSSCAAIFLHGPHSAVKNSTTTSLSPAFCICWWNSASLWTSRNALNSMIDLIKFRLWNVNQLNRLE